MLDGLGTFVQDVVSQLGALGVGGLIVIETLFPPIPSELILPFAGFVSAEGDASLVVMILAATVGSVIGATVLYELSRLVGYPRVRRFVERYGRYLSMRPTDFDRAETWFERNGTWAVTVGRCVPLVRSVISLPAGCYRMPRGRYLVGTAIGSAVWNTVLIGAGYVLGRSWTHVESYVGIMQYVVIAGIALVALRFFWRRMRR